MNLCLIYFNAGPVNCQCRSPKEDKLVLGCADGSVVCI